MPRSATQSGVEYAEIDRVDALSAEDFDRTWRRARRPVVIRGDILARAGQWTVRTMRERMGDLRLTAVRTVNKRLDESGNPFGMVRLGEFLEALERGEHPGWHLSASVAEWPREFAEAIAPPVYCRDLPFLKARVWIAQAGTVTPLHYDLPANFIVGLYGRRQVLLYPPWQAPLLSPHTPFAAMPNFASFDPERNPADDSPLAHFRRPVGTVVGPGDVLYIPHFWWHHIRTIEPSLIINYWCGGQAMNLAWHAGLAYKSVRGIYKGEWKAVG
jgi:hypothetical protein